MIKKTLFSLIATSFFSAVFAGNVSTTVVPPIHWGSHSYDNSTETFKNGKLFCAKKYVGKKVCIPALNNTSDTLSISTASYGNSDVNSKNVVALMGKDALPTTIFTIQDTSPNAQNATVYSGPANNREGVVCNEDETSHAVTCSPWK